MNPPASYSFSFEPLFLVLAMIALVITAAALFLPSDGKAVQRAALQPAE